MQPGGSTFGPWSGSKWAREKPLRLPRHFPEADLKVSASARCKQLKHLLNAWALGACPGGLSLSLGPRLMELVPFP